MSQGKEESPKSYMLSKMQEETPVNTAEEPWEKLAGTPYTVHIVSL